MSGVFPATIGPSYTSIISEQEETSKIGGEGHRQVILRGGQNFRMEATWPIMTRDEWDAVLAFAFKQSSDTFQIVLPPFDVPLGTVSGPMLANGAVSAGVESLNVDGFTGSLLTGSMFKFASHSKVYQVSADRSGVGSLSFHPPLIESVANNEAITYTGVEFTVRFVEDKQSLKAKAPTLAPFTTELIEAIN